MMGFLLYGCQKLSWNASEQTEKDGRVTISENRLLFFFFLSAAVEKKHRLLEPTHKLQESNSLRSQSNSLEEKEDYRAGTRFRWL